MKNTILALMFALLLASCGGARKQKNGENLPTSAPEQTETESSDNQSVVADTDVDIDISKYREYGIINITQGESFVVDAYEKLNVEGLDMANAGINEIRFNNWEEKNWLNNNYIRTVRIYIDAFCSDKLSKKEIENKELGKFDKYKNDLAGKLVVVEIEPFVYGGAYICLMAVENPKLLVKSWVYSFVVEDEIYGYDVRSFDIQEIEASYSKEEILQIIKDNPNNKLW